MRYLSKSRHFIPTLTATLLFSLTPSLAPLNFGFNAGVVQAQTPEEQTAEADRLLEQGKQHVQAEEYQAALEAFQQAYNLYGQTSHPNLIQATVGMGYAYAYLGNSDQATKVFTVLLEVAEEKELPKLVAIAQEGLEFTENIRQSSQDSASNLEEEQEQSTDAQVAEADRLLAQGQQYLDAGEYRIALQTFQRAFEIYEPTSHVNGLDAIVGIAYAYAYLGETETATEIFTNMLNVAQERNVPKFIQIAQEGLDFIKNRN